MKKILILLFACVFLNMQAQAPDLLPQVFSPDAAELGKYGKVPVNYFNGLPNVTIPLTEVRAKNYTLPIYLSYHASGNKPDIHPGWVGQGWSLHAGGCINRIIRGQKDEMTKKEFEDDVKRQKDRLIGLVDQSDPLPPFDKHLPSVDDNPGYLYHANEYQSVNWLNKEEANNYTLLNYYDYEPDEFQINIDDISASFYIVGDGKVKIVSKSDADFTVTWRMNDEARYYDGGRVVDYKFSSQNALVYDTFYEFVITSKDGTEYYFGGDEDAIEYSIHSEEPGTSLFWGDEHDWDLKATANTWMLTMIVRPDGETIYFDYKRDGTPIVMVDSHWVRYCVFSGEPLPDNFNTYVYGGNISFYFLLPSYLESISCEIGKDRVHFNTRNSVQLDYDYSKELFCAQSGDPGLYELMSQNNHYEQLETLSFNHGEVSFSYTKNPNTRLKLNSVEIIGKDCEPMRYSMTYDSTPLPKYYSRKTDMWGYYNYTTQFPVRFQAKDQKPYKANLTLQKAEILTKITYPTGGWTCFEYEPHEYGYRVNQFPFVAVREVGKSGGLRIKKISDYSSKDKVEERIFTYTSPIDDLPSGVSSGRPQYFLEGDIDLLDGEKIHELTIPGADDGRFFHYVFFSENMLNQLSNTDGCHVTYSYVTETIPGVEKTEYKYSNHDPSQMDCMDRKPLSLNENFRMNPSFSSMALYRGLLLSKTKTSMKGKGNMSESYTYVQDTTDCLYSTWYYNHSEPYSLALTKIYTFYPKLTSKMVTIYPDDRGAAVVETTDYEYNSHRQVVRTVRTCNGNQEETRMTYSGDMPGKQSVYGQMQAAGIYDRPIEKTVLHDGKVVSSSLTTYRMYAGDFVPDRYYEARLDAPRSSWQKYNGAITSVQQEVYGLPKLSFDKYDWAGNLCLSIGDDGKCNQYFWDYDGLYPLASFEGLPISVDAERVLPLDVWFYGFEDESIHYAGPDRDMCWPGERTFSHPIPSGVPYTIDWLEMEAPNGVWKYHCAQFNGRITLGEGSYSIDNVRIYPSEAKVTSWRWWTHTGCLQSVTDSKGMIESYEYDAMGRLVTVRDADGNKKTSYEYRLASPAAEQYNHIVDIGYNDESERGWRYTDRLVDGLGRPWQTIRVCAGDTDADIWNDDLYDRTDYDEAGRPYRTWLPFRSNTIVPDQSERPSEPLYSDSEPFSLVEYDGLDRPRAKYGPGANWHANGKAVRYGYYSNGTSQLLSCQTYSVTRSSMDDVGVSRVGPVAAGTLFVESTTDEDGLTLLIFTDMYGRTLLERRHPVSGEDLDTYYVYDGIGRLSAVIPPVLSKLSLSTENVDKYAYLYSYDANGNCVAKKLPGCGWTYYIYDKGNRLVFTQDPELRKKGKWQFSITDIHGRSCVTGYCGGTLSSLRQAASERNIVASRQGNTSGPYMGYDVSGITLTDPVILSVSYYDDYGFIDSRVPSGLRANMRYRTDFSLAKWDHVNGLLTGSAERILGEDVTNDFRWSTCYYDRKGNPIQTHGTRADGGVDIATTEFTFTGKPKKRLIHHAFGAQNAVDEYYTYTYDGWERPLTVKHRIGEDAEWTVVSDLKYDGIGRMKADNRNGKAALRMNYTYNVRSWTRGITGPGLTEDLYYEDNGQWGGNIAAISWSLGDDYYWDSYQYDGMSRLQSSRRLISVPDYCFNHQQKHINEYVYDSQGNITQSTYRFEDTKGGRIGGIVGGPIEGEFHILTKDFHYQGNQLVSCRTMTEGYEYGDDYEMHDISLMRDTLQYSYAYDMDGRLIKSEDNGMTEVRYNVVGYPSYVRTADNGYVQNKYTAGGARLESRRMDSDGKVTTMAYEGNEVIENGKLRMLLFDGGYVDFSGSEPRYCWYTKDHLGSVRAVADAEGNVFASYAYGPYGEDFVAERTAASNVQEGGLGAQPADDVPVYGGEITYVGQLRPGMSLPATTPAATYTANESPDWQPYKFSGKESLTRVGLELYDFGARMYSPSNMRWMTMDPLAEKHYSISPYVYCNSNPINLVDPDGMDDYSFNEQGYYEKTETCDPYDRLLFVDGYSLIVTDKAILGKMEEHNFLLQVSTEGSKDDYQEKKMHYTIVEKPTEELMNVFKALADHTNVEWAVYTCKDGTSVLATQHLSDKVDENAISFYTDRNGINIFSNLVSKIHCHPYGYETEEKSMVGDKNNKKNKPDIESYVYFPHSGNIYELTPEPKRSTKFDHILVNRLGFY